MGPGVNRLLAGRCPASRQCLDRPRRRRTGKNAGRHPPCPVLNNEVLAAQSARIQSVSGATYTSEGYIGSLQQAINQAGL